MVKAIFTDIDPTENVPAVQEEKKEKITATVEEEVEERAGSRPVNPFMVNTPSSLHMNLAEIKARVLGTVELSGSSGGTQTKVQEFPGINQNMLEYFRQQMEEPAPVFHNMRGSVTRQGTVDRELNISMVGIEQRFQVGAQHDILLQGEEMKVIVEDVSHTFDIGGAGHTDVKLRVIG